MEDLSADPALRVNHLLADTVNEHHCLVDLDQGGVYGSEKDTFQGK